MDSSPIQAVAYCKPKSAPHPQPLSPEYRGEGSKTLRGRRDNNRIKKYSLRNSIFAPNCYLSRSPGRAWAPRQEYIVRRQRQIKKFEGTQLQALLHSSLFALLVLSVVGLLLLIIRSAACHALITVQARHRWLILVTAGLLGWLGITAALGLSGLLAAWTAIPPRVLMLPVTYLTVLVSLSCTRSFQQLLAALPLWPLIAVQSYRIAVEILLWLFHQDGRVPVQMTFEGRNLDLLVGVTAPLVAMGVYRQWIGPRGCIVWNLLGMGILLNTIATAATSVPGPLQLGWPGEPFVAIATWPLVWLPAFLAPTALCLHVLSIRQSLRLRGAGA